MKLKKGLFITIIVFSLIPLTVIKTGCRKADHFIFADNVKLNRSELFFRTKGVLSPEIEKVYLLLRRQNERNDFVDKLPANFGNPVWDKIKIFNRYSVSGRNTSGDSGTNAVIPLTADNAFLSGLLKISEITNDSFQLISYSNAYFYNKLHSADLNIEDARYLTGLFLLMDNLTFNAEKFNNIPKKCYPEISFADTTASNTAISLDSVICTGGSNNRNAQPCWEITYQTVNCATPNLVCCSGPGGCDALSAAGCMGTGSQHCSVSDVSITICPGNGNGMPVGGGGDPIGGGGTVIIIPPIGGSGGGTTGSGDPPCGGTWYRPLLPCPGNNDSGGTVIETPPQNYNPCDTVNTYAQGSDFQSIFQALKPEVASRKENLYIFNNLLIPNSATNPITLVEGYDDQFSVYPPTETYFVHSRGWFHNHFADADSAGLIFSSGDLNILAEQIIRDSANFHVNYQNFMIGVVADSNTQYILMVEDISKFATWATVLFTDEEAIQAAYAGAMLSQKYLPLSVAETEKRFLKIIRNAGLRLMRGSNDFSTWTGIKLDDLGNHVITTGACNTISETN